MVSRLRNADVTLGSKASALVIGALVKFWWYADTHIRSDNTLDLGPNEIDELVGVPGFCDLMPDDWIRKIDENSVELPDFQQHNGVEAKRRAVTQKRVERHRNAKSVTPALPDQDQTKTITTASETPKRTKVPRVAIDPDWFLDFKLAYPDRSGDQGWRKALKAANARIAEGHSTQEFIDGAKRYAAYCKATGKVGTEFVKQAATFLGPEKPFLEEWDAPTPKGQAPANWREDPRFKGVA